MEIIIKPFELVQIATKLRFNIIGTTDTTCQAYYELVREDGVIIERGNEEFPIQALAIIAQQPMDVNGLNQLLATWNLEAETPATPE